MKVKLKKQLGLDETSILEFWNKEQKEIQQIVVRRLFISAPRKNVTGSFFSPKALLPSSLTSSCHFLWKTLLTAPTTELIIWMDNFPEENNSSRCSVREGSSRKNEDIGSPGSCRCGDACLPWPKPNIATKLQLTGNTFVELNCDCCIFLWACREKRMQSSLPLIEIRAINKQCTNKSQIAPPIRKIHALL